MGKSDKRIIFQLMCTECNEKNYSTVKNKSNTADKLNLKKYCSRCRKHTPHKEVK